MKNSSNRTPKIAKGAKRYSKLYPPQEIVLTTPKITGKTMYICNIYISDAFFILKFPLHRWFVKDLLKKIRRDSAHYKN